MSTGTMTLGERLRAERERLGLSQAAMAALGGVQRRAQIYFEQGAQIPGGEYLLGIHRGGADIGFVLLGQSSKFDNSSQSQESNIIAIKSITSRNLELKNKLGTAVLSSPLELGPEMDWSGFVQVPRWSVVASLGPGADVYEPQIVETLAFKASFLREMGVNPKHASIITGVGDSMEPKIMSSDFLIVDNAVRAYANKGVYVLAENDRLVAKKIEHERKTGDFLIISENKEKYPMRRVSEDDAATIHIMGRVKRAWSSRPI